MLDEHNQPLSRSFNYSHNKEKAIFGLKGILEGVVADQRLTEQELCRNCCSWMYGFGLRKRSGETAA